MVTVGENKNGENYGHSKILLTPTVIVFQLQVQMEAIIVSVHI